MAAGDGNAKDELEATLQARRELGPAYDDALVESFLDRIEQQVQARVDQRLAERGGGRSSKAQEDAGTRQFVLGIISLGTGIPITAIAGGGDGGVAGVLVAWLGIASVNVAHALGSRRRH
jgi:hypothetical protein